MSNTPRLVDQIFLSEKNDYVYDKQDTKIRELRERVNRLERLAEELAYEDCASSRKDIWQGFKEAQ
jgi:hypothetical protein